MASEILEHLENKLIYISFDLDAFDSSVMLATGVPEPGGLSWNKVIEILYHIGNSVQIIGADVVELAPRRMLMADDFVATKLAYKILNYSILLR